MLLSSSMVWTVLKICSLSFYVSVLVILRDSANKFRRRGFGSTSIRDPKASVGDRGDGPVA